MAEAQYQLPPDDECEADTVGKMGFLEHLDELRTRLITWRIPASLTPSPLKWLTYLRIPDLRSPHQKVTAHAASDTSVRSALEAGVDSIEHAYFVDDATLSLVKQKGVPLVPTDIDSAIALRYDVVTDPQYDTPKPPLTATQISRNLEPRRQRLMRAVAMGIPIAAGSDMYVDLGWSQGEAAKHVLFGYAEAGMRPVPILQAATINAARVIGLDKPASAGRLPQRAHAIGVIKAGAFADIIAVEGDPGADIQTLKNIRFVMKDGTVYVRNQ